MSTLLEAAQGSPVPRCSPGSLGSRTARLPPRSLSLPLLLTLLRRTRPLSILHRAWCHPPPPQGLCTSSALCSGVCSSPVSPAEHLLTCDVSALVSLTQGSLPTLQLGQAPHVSLLGSSFFLLCIENDCHENQFIVGALGIWQRPWSFFASQLLIPSGLGSDALSGEPSLTPFPNGCPALRSPHPSPDLSGPSLRTGLPSLA